MLATFTWMAANALSLYQAIVLVFKRNVQKFFVRASIAAWGESFGILRSNVDQSFIHYLTPAVHLIRKEFYWSNHMCAIQIRIDNSSLLPNLEISIFFHKKETKRVKQAILVLTNFISYLYLIIILGAPAIIVITSALVSPESYMPCPTTKR